MQKQRRRRKRFCLIGPLTAKPANDVAYIWFNMYDRQYCWGVTGILGSLKISPCEEKRLKETQKQNPNCEDIGFQNFPVQKTEDLAIKPTKPED